MLRWLLGEDSHECVYSGGSEYPEPCLVCGRPITKDPRYRREQRLHLAENIARAQRGETPLWAIDRDAL